MSTKKKSSPESIVREIKRKTRRKYSAEEKIRIVLEGLRGEQSITDLSRREGIHPGIYYKWSKAFLEAGKRRLQFWNAIPEWEKQRVVKVAREYTEKSCREVAFHEAIDNVTPHDRYLGLDRKILKQRKRTKAETMRLRKRLYQSLSLKSLIGSLN